MKLRIKDNSIRIRLTRSEVEKFAADGYIAAHTVFMDKRFSYALQAVNNDSEHLTASYHSDVITMHVPETLKKLWTETERVGFDAWMPVEDGQKLYLLLEKDFKCLDETMEDQSDAYDNPVLAKQNS